MKLGLMLAIGEAFGVLRNINLAYKAIESLVTVKLSKSSTSKSLSAFTYGFLH